MERSARSGNYITQRAYQTARHLPLWKLIVAHLFISARLVVEPQGIPPLEVEAALTASAVTPYCLETSYKYFAASTLKVGGGCPEDGGSKLLRNVDTYTSNCTASRSYQET